MREQVHVKTNLVSFQMGLTERVLALCKYDTARDTVAHFLKCPPPMLSRDRCAVDLHVYDDVARDCVYL